MTDANEESMIEITRPQDCAHVDSDRTFIASGRADRAVTIVKGRCISEGGKADGVLALFHLDVNEDPPCHKWMLVFNLPGPGQYQLTVTGETADGEVQAEPLGFTAEARGRVMKPRLIQINSHVNNQNISAEAHEFQPNGFLNERPLGVVMMTDSHGGITYPDSTFSDHVVLEFWSAIFPPLPSETYTLYVADSIGASVETITGLVVA